MCQIAVRAVQLDQVVADALDALGGGGEYALAGLPALGGKALSFFAEYQHIWWSSDTTDMPAAVPTLNFHWQRDSDIVRAGIRMHF